MADPTGGRSTKPQDDGEKEGNMHRSNDRQKKSYGRVAIVLLVLAVVMMMAVGCGGSSGSKSDGSSETGQTSTAAKSKAADTSKEKKSSKASETASKQSSAGKSSTSTGTSSSAKSAPKSSSGTKASSSGKRSAKHTCTISVEAGRIFASKKASAETKALIPSDGYLLHKTKAALKSGDTVSDVLKRVAKAKKLSVSFKSANYVEGIGGLYEFDGGSKSGWMYSVNGTFPNEACNEKKVSNGDEIAWRYTLDLGSDLK